MIGTGRFGPLRFGQRHPKPYVPIHVQADKLLAFIVAYQREHGGVSPSYPEMMAGVDLTGKASVHRVLWRLQASHKIRIMPHRARAIEVISPGAFPAPAPVPLVAPGPDAQFFIVERRGTEHAELVEIHPK